MKTYPFRYTEKKSPNKFGEQSDKLIEERGQAYGDFYELHERIAARFSFVLGEKIKPSTAARLMVELKLARDDMNIYDEDTVVDAINYLKLYGACTSEEHVKQDKKHAHSRSDGIDLSKILDPK